VNLQATLQPGCRAGLSGAGGLARQSAAARRAAAGEEWGIRRADLAAALAAVPRSGGEGPAALSDSGGGAGFDAIGGYAEVPRSAAPPPPPRTKWTRRVPHPVLIGHAGPLPAPAGASAARRRGRGHAGRAQVKEALRRAVEWPLVREDDFRAMGVRPSRGVLLHGAPGCGKTSLVRAVAGLSGLAFFHASGAPPPAPPAPQRSSGGGVVQIMP